MSSVRTLVLVGAIVCISTAARAQEPSAFLQGFGGLRVSSAPGTSGSLGATFGIGLTRNIHAIGEVGRVSNVLPSMLESALGLTPIDFQVSAMYGQGGVRFTAGEGGVRPYGETIAGMARLRTGLAGFGGIADPFVDVALGLLATTRPIAGVGGGVMFERGPFVADVGYRFSRIFASDAIARLTSGGDLDLNQVRVAFGVRF